MEEFKEATVKEMLAFGFFTEKAEKDGIPLEKWCRAYVDYMEEHDEDNIVQSFYQTYVKGHEPFEYQVQILVNTWCLEEEPVPLKKLSKYL